jgi:DNA-binding GntR family transcriptional regulator
MLKNNYKREYLIVDNAYDYINNKIIQGEIELGEKILIKNLSEDLNVSLTPIREAIRKLESQGLIELLPRKGFIVKKYNMKQIDEIYAVRQILEITAIRLACNKIKKKDLDKTKKINKKIYKTILNGKKDILTIKKLNEDFHLTLYKISNNELLCEIIQNLWDRTAGLFIQLFKNPFQGKTTFQEHNEILMALEAKNTDKVVDLMKNHLQVNKESLFTFLNKLA